MITPKNIGSILLFLFFFLFSSGCSRRISEINDETSKKLTREKCVTLYGERQFLPNHLQRIPPLLYTLPGSGNTWTRLLIDYATGIYSGSVYNDPFLLPILPGERFCNQQVSVVKSHLLNDTTESGIRYMSGNSATMHRPCLDGGVKRFERVIFLVRNPFDAIWAEHQRHVSITHVDGIPRASFNWMQWQATAASMSHDYVKMWASHYAAFLLNWKTENIAFVRYEDLKNPATRLTTLRRLVKFLRYEFLNVTDERLECAFLLSKSPGALRHVNESMMTKEEAYVEPIACRMWQTFGKYAAITGYSVFNDYDCTGYSVMPNIRVAGHGAILDTRYPNGIDLRPLPKSEMH